MPSCGLTMTSDFYLALSPRTLRFRSQGADARVAPLISASHPSSRSLCFIPSHQALQGWASSQKRNSCQQQSQGPTDLQVPVLGGTLGSFCLGTESEDKSPYFQRKLTVTSRRMVGCMYKRPERRVCETSWPIWDPCTCEPILAICFREDPITY